MGSLPETSNAVRVLILGGCYGGLSAAVNLLDLSQGYSPRMNSEPYTHHPNLPTFNIEITIVDERDGYCKSLLLGPSSYTCPQTLTNCRPPNRFSHGPCRLCLLQEELGQVL